MSTTGFTQGNLGLTLPPNSLDLHGTQKQQDEILDSPRVHISLSRARNENIKNSSTRQIRVTLVTNSREIAHKSQEKVTRNKQKVKSNEQKITSNGQIVTSDQQKVTSNQQKVTNNQQKVTSNEKKLTSNKQKVQSR